jgi:gamma-glutamylcyclotransferase (GGCT)/AIG2-like uncharacterized protein YtfP
MLDRLFVYGTLMRGFDHPMAKLLAREADYEGTARFRGRLYLIQHYPGLIASDDPADIVHGEVFALRRPAELLATLDDYESCGAGFAAPTEYLRELLPVTREDGAVLQAWTYVYNWPVAGKPWIRSGRFLDE